MKAAKLYKASQLDSFPVFFSIINCANPQWRRVWGAEKASFLSTEQDLWIYLHLRSDSFKGGEWDVFCSAGYYKNTAISLNVHILLFTSIRRMVRLRLFPFHHFSSSLPDWLADSGFYQPPPWRNNSSLLAPHLCIHQAFYSTASCHPSPTNFPIATWDSGWEWLSSLLLNVTVSCGIILKRTLLFKTHFLRLVNRPRGVVGQGGFWFSCSTMDVRLWSPGEIRSNSLRWSKQPADETRWGQSEHQLSLNKYLPLWK